jgi:hypothetical protein
MAYDPYSELIGRAVVDQRFQASLLNGCRAQVLQELGFPPTEREALMSISASTFGEFAGAVHKHLRQQNSSGLWLMQTLARAG